ncbi:UPF0175 family protein [Thiorhodovibrio litoralis]|uniref:UPF0175 family protein n=2 Tax=Thiorhodovibrio TaxID=61593 RepID=UPI003899C617
MRRLPVLWISSAAMTLTLNIPDPLLRRLETQCADVPRRVLEGFAAEAYRSGSLSRAEVGQLLEHESLWETEAFIASHDVWPSPSVGEAARDIETLSTSL